MKTAEAPIEIPKFFTETQDGVQLRYFDTGGHDVGAHPTRHAIVLANGLGGPISAFRPYVGTLGSVHRLLSWDYRGLYGSSLPPGAPHDLRVTAHARDILRVLDCARVEQVTFVGWSMGVQIALEVVRLEPSRVSGLVLMNGTFGRPLRGVALPFSELLLEPLVRGAGSFSGTGTRILRGASRLQSTSLWLKRLGFVAHSFDSLLFREMLDDFKTLDLRHYFALLQQLCHHDAEDMLAAIAVPTLVVSGALDRLTPPRASRSMSERIRGAEFFLVPGATHYAAAEFPELIAKRIHRFIHERVHAAGPSPPTTPTRESHIDRQDRLCHAGFSA